LRFFLLISSLFLTLATASAGAEPGVIRRAGKAVPGHYLVVFDSSKVSTALAAVDELTAKLGVKKTHLYDAIYKGFAFTGNDTIALALSNDPRVRWVQEDSTVTGSVIQNPAPSWALDRLDQTGAVTTDSGGNWIAGQYSSGYTGVGTVILRDRQRSTSGLERVRHKDP